MNFEDVKVGQEVILGSKWNHEEALAERKIGVVSRVSAQRFVVDYNGSQSTCEKEDGQKRGYKGHYSALCLNTTESIQEFEDQLERDRQAHVQRDIRIEQAKALEGKLRAKFSWCEVDGYGSTFSIKVNGLSHEQAESLIESFAAQSAART